MGNEMRLSKSAGDAGTMVDHLVNERGYSIEPDSTGVRVQSMSLFLFTEPEN